MVWINQDNEWYQMDKFGQINYFGTVTKDANAICMNEKELFLLKGSGFLMLAFKEDVIALGRTKKMIKKNFLSKWNFSYFYKLITNKL